MLKQSKNQKREVQKMTVGCDNEYCFFPIIYGTNAVCLECKYCVRREEISKACGVEK